MRGRLRVATRALLLAARSPVTFSRLYRARAASEAGDWARAAALYEQLHEHGRVSDRTRLGLGTAYLGLGRAEAALAQLGAIEGALSGEEASLQRINQAIALSRLRRRDETRALLESADLDAWTPARRRKAETLLAWARGGAAAADDDSPP